MADGMVRRVYLAGAYDKRSSDPAHNYGFHGMDMRFVLIGPKGATQFVVFTGMQLPHVFTEWARKDADLLLRPMGADIGYHSPAPRYEGQQAMDCDILGTTCYYDGSSLSAEKFMPVFLAEGDDVVWTMLARRYSELFDAAGSE